MTMVSDILIMQGTLTADQIEPSLAKYGNSKATDRDLVTRNLISEAEYAQVLAASLGFEYVVLSDITIEEELLGLIQDSIMRRHNVLPIGVKDDNLYLAMVDPNNLTAIDDVTSVTRKIVVPVVTAIDDMESALGRLVRSDDELSSLTAELNADADLSDSNMLNMDDESDEPVVRFVNLIINQAIQDRASDIHLDPGENDLKVRYRIDGVLKDVRAAPRNIQDGIISRVKIISGMNIAERRVPQDGRMTVNYNGKGIDLRVSGLPVVWGEKIVMRILNNTATTMSLREMHMSEKNLEIFTSSYTKPHGMILITGPTGSGKSTTLYTTLNAISTSEVNVVTVEDPVEYRLPGINQVQINKKSGMTFPAALRSILRQDPDVILVGEIRDEETAKIAIESALTGHLVLSTLHTNDAPSSVTRLIEMGVEPFLVSSALESVVAQRLARKLCEKCKLPYEEDPVLLRELNFNVAPDTTIYKPNGCTACSNTGYRGRIALHEVMKVSESIAKLAVAHASGDDIRTTALAEGMTSLRQDGWNKVAQGITTIKEVLRVAI